MANLFVCEDIDLGKCAIDGCAKPIKYAGLCSMHAERKRKHGDPNMGAQSKKGTCSVVCCGKPHYGHGLCISHYKRKTRHGDALGGGCAKGAVRAWLDDIAAAYAGSDCLEFPFGRDKSGYGRINLGNKHIIGAHVYILAKTNGEKPSLKHEACHTCGNGHLGCVNPSHLYWGTRSDNVRDSIRHGTFATNPPRGEQHGNARYTVEQLRKAVAIVRSGETQVRAAKLTGVEQQTISRVINGLSWKGSV